MKVTGSFTVIWLGVRALALTAALFGFSAQVQLLLGMDVHDWTLPASFVVASVWQWRRSGGAMPGELDTVVPRWLVALFCVALGVGVIAVGFGAVTTPDRAWDGVVAWGMRVEVLRSAMTLEQPFFRDPAVLSHSPDYPLLQPLLLASLGRWLGPAPARLLFAVLFAGMVCVVAATVALRTRRLAAGVWSGLGVAATPFFLNTFGGSADSGYAELALGCDLALLAGGLVLADGLLCASAAAMLPWIKPEGLLLMPLFAAVAFVWARPTVWACIAIAGSISLSLWLPLQQSLCRAQPSWYLGAGLAGVCALACGSRAWLDRRAVRLRTRLLCVAVTGVIALLGLVLALPMLADIETPLIGQHLGRIDRAMDKLHELPQIVGTLLHTALGKPDRFGLAFVLFVACTVRVLSSPDLRMRPELTMLLGASGLGASLIVAAFLLSPEPDVTHHLRSSAGRLLAHWIGVAWLVIGVVGESLVAADVGDRAISQPAPVTAGTHPR